MTDKLENLAAMPEDDMPGCCENPAQAKTEKDFRKEADAELERIKREADKANREIEEVLDKGNEE